MRGQGAASASGDRSAATGGNSGVVATGDHNHIEQRTVVLPAGAVGAAVSDDAVARVNNLPTPDSAVFRGRDEALAALEALPAAGGGVVAQSVRGLGGVGKSTLALHHARRFLAAGGGPVWWVDAESAPKVTAGLAALATALNPAHAGLPLEDAAQWAVVWLQGRTGWLLVLDNAEDPADLDPYLGRLTTGQVLITTRRDLPWRDLGTPLRLDTLTPTAAVDVLREITGSTDAAGLGRLAEELGYLPLALQQAGAYLAQTRTSPGDYLVRLRQDPAGVLATGAPGDPQQRTIAKLWSVTLNAVERADPDAVELLRVLAYFGPDPLPRTVLDVGPENQRAIDHALGVLAAYSMITLTEATVTVHRLVQTAVRAAEPPATPAPLPPRGVRRLLRRRTPPAPPHPSFIALSLLSRAMPEGRPDSFRTWAAWQPLLPHIHSVVGHDEITDSHPDLADVLERSASHLLARGQAAQALPMAERAVAISEAALGPEHPDTAAPLNNLASALCDMGRPAEALPLEERALAIAEAALGPEHPDTAALLGNLAGTLTELGRFSEALTLAERSLTVTEKALGPEHFDTALSLDTVAGLLGETGRPADALPLAERALAITERNVGPEHPTTAFRLSNVAALTGATGRAADALPLAERALTIAETALGPEHPVTAMFLSGLATRLTDLDRPAEALPLAERARAVMEAVRGPEHPYTALFLAYLATTLNHVGRHFDALPLAERALVAMEAAMGPEHLRTAHCLSTLATTLDHLGRPAEALPLAQRALTITETFLGADHPDTANRRDDLGALRHLLAGDGDDD
ncbi:tetratricopeptide repeat protein [Streptomyces sparsogenes]|uniref:tetratricopeptide repeat protein n=1 Tax=Streptomyces sparsogenes TaxID=67365 RepID=UPI003400906F